MSDSKVIAFPVTPQTVMLTTASRLTPANVRAAMAAKKKIGRVVDVGDMAYCTLNSKVARVMSVDLDSRFEVERYLVVYAGGIKSWLRPDELRPVTDMTKEGA